MTEKTGPFPNIKDIPASSWEKLSQKKIYFGHQSVGFNILDGIKDLMKEYPQIKLDIIETGIKNDFDKDFFAHSVVGKNRDPESKINDFTRILGEGVGQNVDFAALKFCYVDIEPDTNIEKFVEAYDIAISQIKEKYTDISIIHFTIPLTTVQRGPKAWVKNILGRPVWGIDDNMKRNEYNQILLNKYKDKDSVFNIAEIESTFPDGTRSSFIKNGKTYYKMVEQYTYDSGHLNELGRKIVAEQLLILLANRSK